MSTRKPTRRDLLVVVGRLQSLVGLALQENNDRNSDRQARVDTALHTAHALCIEARSFDSPVTPSGPWKGPEREGELRAWEKAQDNT